MKHYFTIILCLIGLSSKITLWSEVSHEWIFQGRQPCILNLLNIHDQNVHVCGETCRPLMHNSNVEQNVENREVNRVSNKEAGRNKTN